MEMNESARACNAPYKYIWNWGKKHNIYKLLQLLSRSEYTVAFRMCRGSFQFQWGCVPIK